MTAMVMKIQNFSSLPRNDVNSWALLASIIKRDGFFIQSTAQVYQSFVRCFPENWLREELRPSLHFSATDFCSNKACSSSKASDCSCLHHSFFLSAVHVFK